MTSSGNLFPLRSGRHRLERGSYLPMIAAFSLVAGLLAAFSVVATPAPASAAPGDAFDGTKAQVFVAQQVPTRLFKAVTNASGVVEFQPEGNPAAVTYNAISYNEADNYLYGLVGSGTPAMPAGSLIRIGQDGVVTRVGTTIHSNSVVGAFGPNNNFYSLTGNRLYTINASTGAAISSIPMTGTVPTILDIAYKDGFFWSLSAAEIVRLDPISGAAVSFPFVNPKDPTNGAAGAAWTFGNGNLGFSSNSPGTVTQIAVTNPASANPTFRVVSQTAGPSSGNNDGAASVGIPADLRIVKTAPESFVPGETVTYELAVTNLGPGSSSGFVVSDTLPVGMTNVASTTPGCSVVGRTVTCSGGELAVNATATIVITAKTADDATGCITNSANVLGNEIDPVAGNNDSSAESCVRSLEVEKTSTATAATRVGDTVTYTVRATNTGVADYTAAEPAVVLDDLSGVLDDATYNGDVSATVDGEPFVGSAYNSPLLSWVGPLAAGKTVVMTYTVKIKAGGDGSVDNIAWPPAEPFVPTEPPSTPNCGENGAVCEKFDLPRLTINKSADTTELPTTGGTVTYTVVATNSGPGDFTTAAPATAIDDLTAVLDDATFDASSLGAVSAGTVDYSEPRITWTGPLASGESVTITYQVTYTGEGDSKLTNVAFVPSVPSQPTPVCEPGSPVCDTVNIPGANLDVSKSVNPASGTAVKAGDELTYTLTFDNDGAAAADVDWTDFLGGVLDDATVTNVPVAGAGLTVTPITGDSFTVGGSVPAGQIRTVTYTVKVGADGERGDSLLGNFLVPTGEVPPVPGEVCQAGDPRCTTNPIPQIEDHKSVDPESGTTVAAGDELTYTLTFENTGTATGSVDRVDDLTHVLDDATVTTAPVASSAALSVSAVTNGRVTITGDLEPGDKVTVTYTVTVGAAADRGDSILGNFLLEPDQEVPEVPGCTSDDEDCTFNPVGELLDSKSVDPASGTTVVAGQELTYTLTFENVGSTDMGVDRVDDLTHVLDDATVTTAPVASSAALSVSAVTNGRLAITGELEPGDKATVTYTVTVKPNGERGDNIVGNFLLDPDEETPSGPGCVTGGTDCTSNPISEIVDSKSVAPETGSTIVSGQELTYTLTFTNKGEGEGVVDRVDDLTHVLDDAAVTSVPTSSDASLEVSAIADGKFTVTGTVSGGETVTVTYSVKVKDLGDLGDKLLANFLLDPGAETPPPGECTEGSTDCTFNPVSDITVTKTVDPKSGSKVSDGDVLTYTLTFSNMGNGAGKVDVTDHMSGVLDDAMVVNEPESSDAALTASAIKDEAFSVQGRLNGGQTVTVKYSVEVLDYDDQGDHRLGNFVAVTGQVPPSTCVADSPLCTANPAEPPADSSPEGTSPDDEDRDSLLPDTGAGQGVLFGGIAGLLMLLAGGIMVRRSRRAEELV